MTELFDFNLIKWEIPAISIGTTLAPDFSGDGYIAGESPGLVTIDGSPASVELELRDRETRELVKVTQSELDGTYRFDNLNIYREYDIIARDPSRTYKDIVAPAIRPKVDYIYTVSKWKHHHLLNVDFQTIVNGGTPPYTVVSSTDRIEATIDENNLLSVHSDVFGAYTRFTLTITDSNDETLVLTGAVNPAVNPLQPMYTGDAVTVRLAEFAPMWRVLFTQNNGAPTPHAIIICELEMAEYAGGPNLCVGGSPFATSSYNLSGWNLAEAFDGIKTGDTNGWVSNEHSATAALGYNFPSGVSINEVRITTRGIAVQTEAPRDFAVQFSRDSGATWHTYWTVSNQMFWTPNEERTFNISAPIEDAGDPTGPAKFWRLFISDSFNENTAICEIEMYDSIESTTNLCVGGLAASDTIYDGAWRADRAFDGIKTGDQGWSAIGPLPHWIAYKFPEAVEVEKIQLTNRSYTGGQYMPRAFVVQKSNNGIDWFDAWSVTDTTPWSSNETREYTNSYL